jgi:hypothetical protein
VSGLAVGNVCGSQLHAKTNEDHGGLHEVKPTGVESRRGREGRNSAAPLTGKAVPAPDVAAAGSPVKSPPRLLRATSPSSSLSPGAIWGTC